MDGQNLPKICDECLLFQPLCICDKRPRIKLKTSALFLIHHKEIRRRVNSGRLASQCLVNSEIAEIGNFHQPFDWSSLNDDRFDSFFLFPDEMAIDLDEALENRNSSRPIRLVIPDGNWSQARRMNRRRKQKSNLVAVKLPIGPPSEYKVRIARDQPFAVSTFEAAVRALGIIEKTEKIEQQLLPIFRTMVERNLHLRGKLAKSHLQF